MDGNSLKYEEFQTAGYGEDYIFTDYGEGSGGSEASKGSKVIQGSTFCRKIEALMFGEQMFAGPSKDSERHIHQQRNR